MTAVSHRSNSANIRLTGPHLRPQSFCTAKAAPDPPPGRALWLPIILGHVVGHQVVWGVEREALLAMRKDLIAKCYGLDATRKKKPLEKHKKGKK